MMAAKPVLSQSGALEDGRDSLAASNAHRDQRIPTLGATQLVHGLDGN
ncbi:hypothetical protein AWB68_00381 [Caballeronia choica]|jgi:hypothetical protein|uniref:Uncharacterized protein n=1 Tax=Caballeronia choica TaxID=326476 RepID=A0A158F8W9_9BURK|nr:hypothetical protein AWB68_00381 [Caballeronia choica]